jgi:hypothetical protein
LSGTPVDQSTYKNYLAWTDTISGFVNYPDYEYDDMAQYSYLEPIMDTPKNMNDITYDPTNGQWTK